MTKYLEIGATIFGLIQGVLVMFNMRSNWIAYVIQMGLMIVFSFIMHLYGDVLNSLIYLVLGIIGFILWNRDETSKISSCSVKERVIYCGLIMILTFILFLILKRTDDPLPLLDDSYDRYLDHLVY